MQAKRITQSLRKRSRERERERERERGKERSHLSVLKDHRANNCCKKR